MSKRIKRISRVIAVILAMSMLFGFSVSAEENVKKTENVLAEKPDSSVSPRVTYYGNSWYNAGSGRSGSFTVSGTGSRMNMTLKVESFNPNTSISVEVYNASGSRLFNVFSWIGDNLSTGGTYEARGSVAGSSYYTVRYGIIGTDSSGRVMAWTY